MKVLFVIGMVFWLASCAPGPAQIKDRAPTADPAQAEPEQLPADYEIRIISWLRMNSDDPDKFRVLSIEAPRLIRLEAPVPEKDLERGDAVWESVAITQGFKGDPPGPTYHRFYFKNGVIRSVDLK
ncbi:MAG: hypothetical protein MUD16_14465 [Desulfobacterales bacterium]|nr:hypothetical protein [Desulfobacterales bacterium]